MEKQLNPQPGDKIICNNGEEFTCCTREFLQGKNVVCYEGYKIHAYRYNSTCEYTGIVWMGWSLDGKSTGSKEWDIREVIPQDSAEKDGYIKYEGEIVRTWDVGVDIVYSPTYTAEDIRTALIDELGWQESSLKLLMDSLEKVTNSEYKEYLRLKAMFEAGSE